MSDLNKDLLIALYTGNEQYHDAKNTMAWLAASVYLGFSLAIWAWLFDNQTFWIDHRLILAVFLFLVTAPGCAFIWWQNRLKCLSLEKYRLFHCLLEELDSHKEKKLGYQDLERIINPQKRPRWWHALFAKGGLPGSIILGVLLLLFVVQLIVVLVGPRLWLGLQNDPILHKVAFERWYGGHMTFDFSRFDWVSLSAVGTLLAVVVALFYPALRERRRMRIFAHIAYNPEVPGKNLLIVSLTNTGLQPVNIIKWGWKVKKRFCKTRKRHSISTEAVTQGRLPRKLHFADDWQIWATEVGVAPKKIAYIYLIDSTGKKWKVPRRYLRKIRKQAADMSQTEYSKLFPEGAPEFT